MAPRYVTFDFCRPVWTDEVAFWVLVADACICYFFTSIEGRAEPVPLWAERDHVCIFMCIQTVSADNSVLLFGYSGYTAAGASSRSMEIQGGDAIFPPFANVTVVQQGCCKSRGLRYKGTTYLVQCRPALLPLVWRTNST